jgi:L-cysteine desulfidase
VAAVSGTICGLGYQRNYSIKQINDVLNLCLCSSAGSLCDGAKLSCAWKIEAAIVAGFAAMDVVESKIALPDNEGLVNRDAFETIKSIGILSRGIMNDTNSIVVDIIDKNERAK